MKRFAALLFTVSLAGPTLAQDVPPAITAAVNDPGRPQADRDKDPQRHARHTLALMGIKPGDKVADFLMGGGYWTRIMAKVVGNKGHVYAYQSAEFIKFRPAYADEQKTAVAPYANVTPVTTSLAAVSFPEPLDGIITVDNYHDLHLGYAPPGFAATVMKSLYDSLKPGGVLLVVDHVANTDPDFAVPQKLHRIDPAAARKEIESVGFVFDGEGNELRNTADKHELSIFDPAMRGKTDQFTYRFHKPA